MFKHFFLHKVYFAVAIGIIVTILLSLIAVFNSLQSLHLGFSNQLYTYNNPSEEIVIIGVDDKSVQPPPEGLGRFNQWTRENFIQLLDVLKDEGPQVITFDFLFHTPTTTLSRDMLLELNGELKKQNTSKDKLNAYDIFLKKYISINHPVDVKFAEKLKEFDNIILAAQSNGQAFIKPLYEFSTNTTLGIGTNFAEEGAIYSATPKFKLQGEVYDDMAVATVKKYLQLNEVDLPLENDKLLINFFGPPFAYQYVSFADVLNKQYVPGTFKNKIVLVGPTSSKEFHDEYFAPVSSSTPMPGIEFRANEIQTILDGKFLHNQSTLSQILTIAGISMTLATILSYLGVVLSVVVTFTAIILYVLAAHFFYRQGLILNMIYPFIAIILTYLASWVYKYFVADKKKREMKNAFGHYVSKELVEQISNNPDLVKLGGEKRQVTVFFSDIQDSTALSEQIAIEEWVKQINEYFTAMERIVMQSGGTLDKYEGDAIMAFWNAPIAQQDHVLRGYLAALTMMKTLKQLQQKWQQEGKPAINIRIGINTGDALVGNFGSENRLDYTVMGDTVNTASRLESAANKSYKTRICVSGISESQKPSGMILRELDKVLLPGKKEAVSIFELVCAANEYTPEMQQIVTTYQQGLAAYRAKNWQEAIAHFSALSLDPPSQVMLARCQVLVNGGAVEGLEMEGMVFRIAHK